MGSIVALFSGLVGAAVGVSRLISRRSDRGGAVVVVLRIAVTLLALVQLVAAAAEGAGVGG